MLSSVNIQRVPYSIVYEVILTPEMSEGTEYKLQANHTSTFFFLPLLVLFYCPNFSVYILDFLLFYTILFYYNMIQRLLKLFFHLFLGRTVSRLLLAHTVCVQGTFRSTCSVSCISSLLILFVNVIPNTDFRKVTRIVAVFCSSCDINIPLPYIWLGETADCASSGVFLVSYFYQNVLC